MKKITIGRSLENNLCIEDPSVSRRHAEIIFEGSENGELADLSSTHGTFVDFESQRKRVDRHLLRPGEKIIFGGSNPFTIEEIMEKVMEATQPGLAISNLENEMDETISMRKRCQHCRSVVVQQWKECPFCGGAA